MIKLKLNELLESHALTISEFSADTGLARSTITPMVNKPSEVKAIKIETINVICDYFGVNIEELIEFLPETKKYTLINYFVRDDAKESVSKSVVIVLKKQLGNSERLAIIYMESELMPIFVDVNNQETSTDFYIESDITVLNKEDVPADIAEVYKDSKIMDSESFLKDFKRQNLDIQMTTTKILAKCMIKVFNDTELKNSQFANFIWTDFPFFERKKFTFEIKIETDKSVSLDFRNETIS